MNRSKILKLLELKGYLRYQRNRYYTIAYFGNYSPQARNMALDKIRYYEEQIDKIKEEIEKERNLIWKTNLK